MDAKSCIPDILSHFSTPEEAVETKIQPRPQNLEEFGLGLNGSDLFLFITLVKFWL